MPVTRLNDATFASLGTLSRWLGTKTPSETIDLIVQEKMEQLGLERDEVPETATPASDEVTPTIRNDAKHFDTAPGLAFTKPVTASVNGRSLLAPRWSDILVSTVAQVKAKGLEGQKLVEALNIPATPNQYEEHGFTYYPELGISVQGQSASDAWKEVDRLANKWLIPVRVEFYWRQNPKAQYPGKAGVLRAGNA